MKLHDKFGPIITDEESEVFFLELVEKLKDGDIITLDFSNIIAMTTKSSKTVFGNIYLELGREEFYRRIIFKNTTPTIQEIIYDSILNTIKNQNVV
jgi:hypothetical protein